MNYSASIITALCLLGTAAYAQDSQKAPPLKPEAVMDAALAKEPVQAKKKEPAKKTSKKKTVKSKKKPASAKPPAVYNGKSA